VLQNLRLSFVLNFVVVAVVVVVVVVLVVIVLISILVELRPVGRIRSHPLLKHCKHSKKGVSSLRWASTAITVIRALRIWINLGVALVFGVQGVEDAVQLKACLKESGARGRDERSGRLM
jgi:predicted RND superfamily exporter protein